MENIELKQLGETMIDSSMVFDGKILHVYNDSVKLPNDNTATREVIRHIGAVCVVPVLENGDVIVERQYRYPIDQVITEIPAGKLDSADEDRLAAAKRELKEETGYSAEKWTDMGLYYPAAAYSDEKITMYLAEGLSLGERSLDDDEFLNVVAVPLSELADDIISGKITDGKTQVAILKAEKILSSR